MRGVCINLSRSDTLPRAAITALGREGRKGGRVGRGRDWEESPKVNKGGKWGERGEAYIAREKKLGEEKDRI